MPSLKHPFSRSPEAVEDGHSSSEIPVLNINSVKQLREEKRRTTVAALGEYRKARA